MTKEALEALIGRLELWGLVFGVMVVVGVGGESLVGIRIWWNSRKLHAIQRAEEQQRELTIATLNQEAATLRKEAEDERKARVELEASVAWRKLTKEQKSSFTSQLSIFHGQTVGLWYLTGDTESERFAYNLVDALRAARWNALSPGPFTESAEGGKPWNMATPPSPLPTGIGIGSTPDKPSRDAAAALLRTLCALGFDAKEENLFKELKEPYVVVYVEPRPEGPQGEAKLRAEEAKKTQQTSRQVGKP